MSNTELIHALENAIEDIRDLYNEDWQPDEETLEQALAMYKKTVAKHKEMKPEDLPF